MIADKRIFSKSIRGLNSEHYLLLLEKKPRAVWNAQPVKAIGLRSAFWDFAKKLGSDYEVVKLLKLLVSVKQIGAEAMRRPKEYYHLRDL